MSWKSVLADIGLGVAAPFTGGASLAFIPAANAAINSFETPDAEQTGNLSQLLGQTAAGRAAGRVSEGSLQNQRASLQQQQYQSVLNSLMDQARLQQNQQTLNLQRPGAFAKQAVQGDFLANAQDAGVTGLPTGVPKIQFTGGLRPSMLSSQTRQLGQTMSQNALTQGQAPEPSLNLNLPKPPDIPNLPQSSGMDSLLSNGSLISGILSTLSKSAEGGTLLQQLLNRSGSSTIPGDVTNGLPPDLTQIENQNNPWLTPNQNVGYNL